MNITVRNIPDEIVKKIKTLSQMEKRSINNEILVILEKGLRREMERHSGNIHTVSKHTQLAIWQRLAGQWRDTRTTREIIADIISHRSLGRDIDL
jgi:plasmid stability protein